MSIFAGDGDVFIDANLGAEEIIVYPDGVTERTGIYAMIDRRPPQHEQQQRRVLEKQTQIRLHNSATKGIALSELVLGKTKVRLAPDRRGGTLQTLLVHMPDDGLPWHDDGMIRLIVK